MRRPPVVAETHPFVIHVVGRCFTRTGARFAAWTHRTYYGGTWHPVHDPHGLLDVTMEGRR